MEKNSEEQRAELTKLRLAVSELELMKESLLFQTSSHEGTISSLKSQVRERGRERGGKEKGKGRGDGKEVERENEGLCMNQMYSHTHTHSALSASILSC